MNHKTISFASSRLLMILIVFIIFKTSLVCPCAFLLIDLPLSVFWEMGFKISYADFTLSSLVLFCIFFFSLAEKLLKASWIYRFQIAFWSSCNVSFVTSKSHVMAQSWIVPICGHCLHPLRLWCSSLLSFPLTQMSSWVGWWHYMLIGS